MGHITAAMLKALAMALIAGTAAVTATGRNLLLATSGSAECGLYSLGCTAGDIVPGTSPTAVCMNGCVGSGNACTAGSAVTVQITESLQFTTNANRYDFVYTTNKGGGLCTGEVVSPPYPNGQFVDLDKDSCGDLNLGGGGTLTYTLQPVTIPCVTDGSGFLVWDVCFGYNPTSSGSACSTPSFAVGQIPPSKCKCARINLPISVVSCTATTCPAWASSGYTWPSNAVASDASPTGCASGGDCNAGNCTGRTDGYCLDNVGPGGLQQCFYAYKSSSSVCRPAAGSCDIPESCDGTSPSCPADTKLPSTTVCRPTQGCCDPPEYCTGTASDCPADQVSGNTVVCLQTSGATPNCTMTVTCDGTSPVCPFKAVPT